MQGFVGCRREVQIHITIMVRRGENLDALSLV
jgi:hypothetical protein